MASHDPTATSTHSLLLDPFAFQRRLIQEVARVRRSGGFVSLAAIQRKALAADIGVAESGCARLADLLGRSIRLQDVLARSGSTLFLLMPDTMMNEAVRAAERLLGVFEKRDGIVGADREPRVSVGLAAVYGDVEGGGEALLEAAEAALAQAAEGRLTCSTTLSGRPRVLVVDDEPASAKMLAETLDERGWEGHPCTQVADAYERVAGDRYSALIVDLVLPGSSGAEILRRALKSHPRRPAVLMSGYDGNHDAVLEALSLGPVMFLKKPIVNADLDAALQMFRALLPGARERTRPEDPAF
jgi:PleD family two-component response regulator